MKLNEWNAYTKGPKAGLPKSLTDRVVRYLVENRKADEVLQLGRKYRKFIRSKEDGSYYFVGTSGAVRVGKNSSTSISITDKMKAFIEKWERQAHPEEWKGQI